MGNNKRKEKEKQKNIEKIEKIIKDKHKIENEVTQQIKRKIVENFIIAIIFIIYLYLLYLGSQNIETSIYLTDLKVFSIGLVIVAIIIFEYSYKKDSGIMCIHGIEVLVIGIVTLFSIYIYSLNVNRIFSLIITFIAILVIIYFIIKCIIILFKMKKQSLKSKDDIKEIIQK